MDMDTENNININNVKETGVVDMDKSSVGGIASHFTLDTHVTVLFKPFTVESRTELGITCLVFVFLGVLYEGLRCLRVNVAQRQGRKTTKVTCTSKAHIIQTLLHFFETIFAYMLMLVAMTFNYWLFLAIVSGSVVGLQLCVLFSSTHHARTLNVLRREYEAQSFSSRCPKSGASADPWDTPDDTDKCGPSGGEEMEIIEKQTHYKTPAQNTELVELVTSSL